MGSRPSLTWRSLMETRDLLQQGCRRRIGSNEFTWHYDNKGRFPVRSAYELEMKIKRIMLPSTSNSEANEGNSERSRWSYIWKNNTPPKVRTFIWRACHEALLTAVNLAKRATRVDERCVLCESANETVDHGLFHCSFARQGKSVKGDWFFTVCWGLWTNRCQVVMEGKVQSPMGVIHHADRVYEEYREAAKSLRIMQSNDALREAQPSIVCMLEP
ncbi:UNVERIFIED_CONTAM: hypothetical protein Sradi_0192300 [Sesamum radiatum]|uniref:Reverse transcriptase zinc-binding domain-containing protein n=1 Tax=Sesamum radiatum TaxID=300843 RepID=A0AAW2VYP8_SESRA